MKILLVDDDTENLSLLETILSLQGYETLSCENGTTALQALDEGPIDLILLDVVMPGLSGYDVARQIKATRQIPIILLTGLKEENDVIRGLECGADEFITKPFLKEELLLRIQNLLRLKEYQNDLEKTVNRRAGQLRNALKSSSALNQEMIYRLLMAAECRNDASGHHITRIGKYSCVIAENLGLKGEYVNLLEDAATMHDVGKIGVPDTILLKPGKLTADEFEIIKSHTTMGATILRESEFPLVNMSYDISLTHHEKWDGTGYPNGMKGEEIPLTGRIVALADVFDALTSKRPYKEAYSWEESLKIIRAATGTHFDPAVVEAFFKGIDRIRAIYEEYRDPDTPLDNDQLPSTNDQ